MPCALPTDVVSLGLAVRVADAPEDCELLIAGCTSGDCAWWRAPLNRVTLGGTALGEVHGAVAGTWVLEASLVFLDVDGGLWVHAEGAPARELLSGVRTLAPLGPDALIVSTDDGAVHHVPLGDGDPQTLSDDAEVLHVISDPPALLLLEAEPWEAPECGDSPRGALIWVPLDTGERQLVARDVGQVLGVHASTGRVVHDVIDATTAARTVWVTSLHDPSESQAFRTLPPPEAPDYGGCSNETLAVDLSPDGRHLAFRQTRITLEEGGFGGLYPNLELEVVRADAVDAAPVLVPCGPISSPTVLDDGVLCDDDLGLRHLDFDGGHRRLGERTGGLRPIGARQWIAQVYDDDLPMIEDVFRVSSVQRLDLDAPEAQSLTWLADGFLVDVHHDRWVVLSTLPEAWLGNRPEDIGWQLLDLHQGGARPLPGALRPEAVLGDGRIVLYAPWGTSEHDPQTRFVGPAPPAP